jgi:hypothetical protein
VREESIDGSVLREIRKLQRNVTKGERNRKNFDERWVSRMANERRESQSAAVGFIVLFVLMFSVLLSFFVTDAVT